MDMATDISIARNKAKDYDGRAARGPPCRGDHQPYPMGGHNPPQGAPQTWRVPPFTPSISYPGSYLQSELGSEGSGPELHAPVPLPSGTMSVSENKYYSEYRPYTRNLESCSRRPAITKGKKLDF